MDEDATINGSEASGDYFFYRIQDGPVSADFGFGYDSVQVIGGGYSQIRVTFTSSEAGNGNPNDAGTATNQDGGLAVRVQGEDGADSLTGAVGRFDDEGISFLSDGTFKFDVRDLVSGTQRGDMFDVVRIGTSGADSYDEGMSNLSYYINGGMGDDRIVGGMARDFLVGGAGNDYFNASGGNDTILAGGGDDIVFAGTGNDVIIYNISNDGNDLINGGAGLDTLQLSANLSVQQVRVTFTSAEVGNRTAVDAGTLANQDGGLAVRIQAEDGNDGLTGNIGRTDDEGFRLIAMTGFTFDVRDLVAGTQRGDQFLVVELGSAGGDTLDRSLIAGNQYLNAGQGNDRITAGFGDDFLVGGAGRDILIGGAGNDSFIGGADEDAISGGDGDDAVTVDVSTAGSDTVNLGAGDDVVNVSGASQVRLTFTSSEVGNGTAVDAGTLANQDGRLAVRMQAEDGMDGLTGAISRYDDEGTTFVAASGTTFDVRDLVSGTARGSQFQIVSVGTQLADSISYVGAATAAYINGGMGNDSLTGSDGDDFLVGGGGDDILVGGAGNDNFIGGGGADSISGGDGDDVVTYDISTGGADLVNLGAGTDRVLVSGAAEIRLTFTSSEVGNGNFADSGTMANQDGLLAVRMQSEDGSDGLTGAISRYDDEGIVFTAQDDTVFDVRDLVSGTERGDFFKVVVLGTGADEVFDASTRSVSYYINAGMGNDTLTGSQAGDFLVGGAGDDILNGSGGLDNLIGGGGADVFVFDTAAPGDDRILDFVSGTDKIDLSAYGIDQGDVAVSTVDMTTFLAVDTDSDGMADFTVQLVNVTTAPVATDYIF